VKEPLLPYRIEVVAGAATVTARSGLPLMVETMRASGMRASFARHVRVRERQSGYSEADKGEWLMTMMGAGGDCVDDIAVLRADEGLCRVLGKRPPSPGALLQYLYAFHDEALVEKAKRERPEGQEAYIPEENAALQGLGRVNVEFVRWVASHGKLRKATLDHDATILEAHKKQALWHYKGGRGYQPAAIYWAEQDLVLCDEFRDGNVPAGMSNLPLIRRGFQALPETVTGYFFRADSACYEEKVLKWLSDPERPDGPKGKIGFTISADMTEPLHAVCAAVEEKDWTLLEERADETVWCGEVEFTPGNWPKDAWPLRYLVLRIRKKQGLLFAQGYDTKYLAVVTNREGEVKDLIRWHWEKAGTIEHVHDVTKNEAWGGDPAVRAIRGQRGVVSAEPDELQRAERDEVAGAAGEAPGRAAQAAAVHRVHDPRAGDLARRAAAAARERGRPSASPGSSPPGRSSPCSHGRWSRPDPRRLPQVPQASECAQAATRGCGPRPFSFRR
jgi:hypothetical protein